MANTRNQTHYTSGNNGNNVHRWHVSSHSIQLPTINIVNHNHDYSLTETPLRLTCKSDMLSTSLRNPKISYRIEREKRRSSEYRRHVSSEVKNIATQSVITGSNKLSCSDIYNIIQRGRPSKAQRKFIERIISDKRDRKSNHTLE